MEKRKRAVENLAGELAQAQKKIDRLTKKLKMLESGNAKKAPQERFKELADLLPQVVFEADTKGRITYANRSAFKLTGYSKKDLKKGVDITQLFVPEDRKRVRANLKKIAASSKFENHEYNLIRKNGTVFPVQIFSSPIIRKRRVVGVRGIAIDLSERKNAERALAESEERYRQISELTSDSAFAYRVEADGNLTKEWVAGASERMTGYTFQEIEKMKGWGNILFPEDRDIAQDQVQALMAGKSKTIEYRIRCKGGEIKWIRDYARPIRDKKQKRTTHIVGAMQDITERKQTEETLRESEERFRNLSSIATEGIMIHEGGVILDANKAFSSLIGFDGPEQLIGKNGMDVMPFTQASVQRVREHMLAGSTETYDIELIDRTGHIISAETNGNAINYQGRPARIVRMRDITERKQAEQALQKSEASFRSIFEKSAAGYVLLSPDGRLLKVNAAMAEMLGYTVEELQLVNFRDITHPDDIPVSAESVRSLLAGEQDTYRFEKRYLHRNGTTVWCFVHTTLVRDNRNSPLYFITSITEITKRKQAEEALNVSEERYRLLFETANDAIFILKHGTFLNYNQKTLEMFQCTPEQIINKTPYDFSPPRQPDGENSKTKALEKISAALKGEPQFFEWIHTTTNGTAFAVEVSLNRINLREGKYLLAIVRDISARKKSEQELQTSEERFRIITENAMEWIWELDAEGRYVYVSDVVEKILGIPPEDFINKKFFHYFHPEEKKRYGQYDFEKMTMVEPFRGFEHRQQHKNGEFVWFSTSGMPLADQKGKIIGYRGVNSKITERKLAEQALRESEEKYRKMFELSPEAIVMVDASGTILDANQKTYDIFGSSPEEIIGKNFLQLPYLPQKSIEKVMEMIERRKKKNSILPYELEILTKTGDTRITRIISAQNLDPTSHLQMELIIIQDITEQKKITEDLIRAKQEWERTFDTVPELIAIIDTDYAIRRVNLTMANRLGKHPRDLVGRKCHQVIHGVNEPPEFCPHKKTTADGREHMAEFYEKKLAGDFSETVTPWHDEKGKIVGSVLTAMDISERKWVEELVKNQRDLAQELSVTTTLQRAVSLCLDTAVKVSGLDSGGGYLVNPKSGDLELINSKGLSPEFTQAASRYPADSPNSRLVKKGEPVYQDYETTFPQPRESPMKKEGLAVLAIVPILHEGEVVGCLNIASHSLEQIPPASRNALETIAAQIGDVIVRIRAEDKLRVTMAQLQALTFHLQNAREQERIQVARELHDELSSMLTILKMWVVKISEGLTPFADNKEMAKMKKKTADIEELINKSVNIVRNIITRLRPSILDDLGLIPAMEWLADDFKESSGLTCSWLSKVRHVEIEPAKATAIFRIFQESLSNIVRHAHASRITIRLNKTDSLFTLDVRDNGQGILQSDIDKKESFGISGMRERAKLFEWEFTIDGERGKGTRIVLQVPLAREAQ